jgi:hypothetical protein
VVVGAAIVLIVVFVMIVKAAAGGGGDDDKKAAPPSLSPVPSLSEEAPADTVPDCTGTDIDVEAEATDSSFTDPAKPTVTVAVRNKGSIKCVIDPAAVHIHVTSGSDRIFDSDDNCDAVADPGADDLEEPEEPVSGETLSDEELLAELDAAPGPDESSAAETPDTSDPAALPPAVGNELVLLEPGATESVSVSWNRERSAPECEPHLLTTPGAGTYHAVFAVAGVESQDVTFALD